MAQALEFVKNVWQRLNWREVAWHRVARNILIILGIVAAVVLIALAALNTPPGRRLLVQFATGIKLNSGLKFEIGRIDGSLYGDMTLYDVKVRDPKGVFITSPQVHLDWRPFGYLNKHLTIRDFSSPRVDVLRQPALNPEQNPSKSNAPLLPDLKIDIDRVRFDAINLAAPVMGDARTLHLTGAAHILHRRATIDADAGSSTGDLVNLHLAAIPDANKLDIQARISAPTGGMIDDLLHLKAPLTATIGGAGAWKLWRGKAVASLGEDPLMNLDLTAQDGTFTVHGPTWPGLILQGETAALLRPAVIVDLTAKGKNRKYTTDLKLNSDALAATAQGVIDLAGNHFDKVEAHLRLIRPDLLGQGYTGDDLHADLTVDGDFSQPRIDYDLKATRFGLGNIRVTGLTASGRSHGDATSVTIPVKAQATAISGIDSHVDPLLTHLTLTGDLRIADGKLTSDNIRLDSDRAKATGTLRGDTATGSYIIDTKATVRNYTVAEIGTMNATTQARIAIGKSVAVTGTAIIDTTKWANGGLTDVLGAKAHLTGTFAYTPDGTFAFSKVTAKAPLFTLASAQGNIRSNGAIALKAAGTSTTYGPLDIVATGTLNHPQALLHAASPGLGLNLRAVTAHITGDGTTDYGPVTADTVILIGKGPLIIDINTATLAGITATGKLTQTPQGPFSGALAVSGSGLDGTASLSAIDGVQAATVNATGSQVTLPGDLNIHIGRAILTANLVLRDQLELNGDVQMADASWQDFALATGRARIQLKGQRGTVQAVANGSRGVPFTVAVNGDIAPDLLTVVAKGSANGIAFALDHPAHIHKSGADWVLQPVTVVMAQGRLDLAGRLGQQMKAQAQLHDLDLSIANLFSNDLGISGRANGSAQFIQDQQSFPTARLNLKIDNFSRASAAVVSSPVDLTLDAQLNPNLSPSSNYLHAIVRQGGTIVGRVQADLAPGGGGAWMDRVMNAGLSGGVRYNGPAGVPFSLTGLPRQSLIGAVALAADFSGQLKAPQLTGIIKATSLTYDNETFGTRISSLALDGHFTNDRLELTSFSGRAGEGTIKGSGWLSLAAAQHFPLKIHADLYNARLARSDAIDSTISGTLDATNDATAGALIKGDLRLPQLKYQVVRQGAAQVNVLDGVHKRGDSDRPQVAGDTIPSSWKLDIRARAANRIFVSGMGLESEWEMDLNVIGTTADPRVIGEMKTVRGNYTFAGKGFVIDSGTITFDGGALVDPQINIQASGDMQDIKGIIKVTGSAQKPSIAFSSTPALPQDEVLSRMLFGESVTNLSATEALQLASAVNGLNGGTDFLNPLGALRSATGIDRLRLLGADAATGRGTALAAGKYLTNNVYVEIVTDAKGFTATQLEVSLSHALSVLSQVGNQGTAVSLRYSKDY